MAARLLHAGIPITIFPVFHYVGGRSILGCFGQLKLQGTHTEILMFRLTGWTVGASMFAFCDVLA